MIKLILNFLRYIFLLPWEIRDSLDGSSLVTVLCLCLHFSRVEIKNLRLFLCIQRMFVAQKEEWIIYFSVCWCFNPRILHSPCWSVFGKDNESKIAPTDCSIGVWMSLYEFLMCRLALCRQAACHDCVCAWVNADSLHEALSGAETLEKCYIIADHLPFYFSYLLNPCKWSFTKFPSTCWVWHIKVLINNQGHDNCTSVP